MSISPPVRSGPAAIPASISVRTGVCLAGLGALAFSGKAILAKLMYRHGVDAVQVLFFRMLLAAPLFAALAWWAGRGRPALSRRDAGAVGLLGFCGYYLASFLDFLGLQYISAGLERLILYLNPTLVLLIGVLALKRPVGRRQLLALLVSYAGVLLVFGGELARPQGPPGQVAWGAALVFGSALSYAVYLVLSGEVVQRLGALRLTGWATMVACGLCVAQFFVLRPLQALVVPAPVLGLSLLNALLCTFAPVVLVMLAVQRLGAARVAQVGMLGPLATVVLGVWLLDEPFHAALVAGTVLVLAGVAVLNRGR